MPRRSAPISLLPSGLVILVVASCDNGSSLEFVLPDEAETVITYTMPTEADPPNFALSVYSAAELRDAERVIRVSGSTMDDRPARDLILQYLSPTLAELDLEAGRIQPGKDGICESRGFIKSTHDADPVVASRRLTPQGFEPIEFDATSPSGLVGEDNETALGDIRGYQWQRDCGCPEIMTFALLDASFEGAEDILTARIDEALLAVLAEDRGFLIDARESGRQRATIATHFSIDSSDCGPSPGDVRGFGATATHLYVGSTNGCIARGPLPTKPTQPLANPLSPPEPVILRKIAQVPRATQMCVNGQPTCHTIDAMTVGPPPMETILGISENGAIYTVTGTLALEISGPVAHGGGGTKTRMVWTSADQVFATLTKHESIYRITPETREVISLPVSPPFEAFLSITRGPDQAGVLVLQRTDDSILLSDEGERGRWLRNDIGGFGISAFGEWRGNVIVGRTAGAFTIVRSHGYDCGTYASEARGEGFDEITSNEAGFIIAERNSAELNETVTDPTAVLVVAIDAE